jgi:hypothetical protein
MDNIILNVNSCFADLTKYTTGNFVYPLDQEIKNIIYIKMGSIEFPTSNYNFLSSKGNTSFKIGDGTIEDTVTIPDGNYESDTIILKIEELLDEINTTRSQSYELSIDIFTGEINFSNTDDFTLDFTNNTDYGSLGIHLGFKDNNYSGTSILGETVINLNGPNYYFIKINNFNNVQDHYVKNSFAKIIKTKEGFDTIIEGKHDYVSKDMVFRSPINLSKLEIQIVDYKDNIIDFNGIDLSLTLEIGYIYDKKLYQQINNNGIPNGDHRLKFYY